MNYKKRYEESIKNIEYLNNNCIGIKIGNSEGKFIGYWNCNGNIENTIKEIKKRQKANKITEITDK